MLAAWRRILDRRVDHGVHALDGAMLVLLLHALTIGRELVRGEVALEGDVASCRLSIVEVICHWLCWEKVFPLKALGDLKRLRGTALNVRSVELNVPVYRLVGNIV